MKKILLMFGCLGLSLIVSGCGKKSEPIVKMCDDVNAVISKYEDKKIDRTTLLKELEPLKKQCSLDSEVCVALNSTLLTEKSNDEIIDASLRAIQNSCQRAID